MNPTLLRTRVTLATAIAVVSLSLAAGWLAGAHACVGVLAGGVLGLVNFRWLARGALSALTCGAPSLVWSLVSAARFAVLGGAIAIALWTGLAHPVGVLVGLSVLPCAIVAQGLIAARPAVMAAE